MEKIKDIIKDLKRYTIFKSVEKNNVINQRRVIIYAVNDKEAIKKAEIIDNYYWSYYSIEKIEELDNFEFTRVIKTILPKLREIGKKFQHETLKKTRTPEYFDWENYLNYLEKVL